MKTAEARNPMYGGNQEDSAFSPIQDLALAKGAKRHVASNTLLGLPYNLALFLIMVTLLLVAGGVTVGVTHALGLWTFDAKGLTGGTRSFNTTTTPSTANSTSSPSVVPSQAPSHAPTSSKPSRSPSTSKPSSSPVTSKPSLSPSRSPSKAPTVTRPTNSPSSSRPSISPSKTPSRSPSTSRPSRGPTTAKPSAAPSRNPTTSRPSRTPSRSPSTSRPSRNPTLQPSLNPTTSKPSRSPSTSRPSRNPSTASPTMVCSSVGFDFRQSGSTIVVQSSPYSAGSGLTISQTGSTKLAMDDTGLAPSDGTTFTYIGYTLLNDDTLDPGETLTFSFQFGASNVQFQAGYVISESPPGSITYTAKDFYGNVLSTQSTTPTESAWYTVNGNGGVIYSFTIQMTGTSPVLLVSFYGVRYQPLSC